MKRAGTLCYSKHAIADRVVAHTKRLMNSYIYPLAVLINYPGLDKRICYMSDRYLLIEQEMYKICRIKYDAYVKLASSRTYYPRECEPCRVYLDRPHDMINVAIRALRSRNVRASDWTDKLAIDGQVVAELTNDWFSNFRLVSNVLRKYGIVLQQEGILVEEFKTVAVSFRQA